ncbi:hypothetical protein D3C81_724880 [compost metagenome]
MCCRAKALSKGNPTTHPIATMHSEPNCFLSGRFSLKTINVTSANIPAIEALASVTNTGSNAKTAIRVAGNEPLNNTTPIKPFNQPLAVFSCNLLILNSAMFQPFTQSSSITRTKHSHSF